MYVDDNIRICICQFIYIIQFKVPGTIVVIQICVNHACTYNGCDFCCWWLVWPKRPNTRYNTTGSYPNNHNKIATQVAQQIILTMMVYAYTIYQTNTIY